MATTSDLAKRLLHKLSNGGFEQLLSILKPLDRKAIDPKLNAPSYNLFTNDATQQRLEYIEECIGVEVKALSSSDLIEDHTSLHGNIEQYIGMTQIPTGITGPIQVNGTNAKGEFLVPMATTEGALIASYNRGCRATRLSGGITAVCLTERVQRAPMFKFNTMSELGLFVNHVIGLRDSFPELVSQQSSHAKLEDVLFNIEGNQLIIIFEYYCADASGQNMVTFCTDAICKEILANSPIDPKYWYIESNYSGDKKATARSFSSVRGRKVSCECVIFRDIVESVLKTSPEAIAHYWQSSTVAAIQSGSIGAQGHIANGLTAIFVATGQDIACVSEASIGLTRMEVNNNNDLYIAGTFPALIVGTVGGGTALPTQNECLKIMQCDGPNHAQKFAEIIASTLLAGELSIAAALASQDFAKAHQHFGRAKHKIKNI